MKRNSHRSHRRRDRPTNRPAAAPAPAPHPLTPVGLDLVSPPESPNVWTVDAVVLGLSVCLINKGEKGAGARPEPCGETDGDHLPLYSLYERLGARVVPFIGFEFFRSTCPIFSLCVFVSSVSSTPEGKKTHEGFGKWKRQLSNRSKSAFLN